NGVLVSQGYTTFVNPAQTIAAGAGATALQAFVNAGGIYVGSGANGTTTARNAGITLLNTASISGLSTPGSTFDGNFSTATPAGWGFDAGGWIYRSATSDPAFNPSTMVGNGTTIPTPTAVATYGPSGASLVARRPQRRPTSSVCERRRTSTPTSADPACRPEASSSGSRRPAGRRLRRRRRRPRATSPSPGRAGRGAPWRPALRAAGRP